MAFGSYFVASTGSPPPARGPARPPPPAGGAGVGAVHHERRHALGAALLEVGEDVAARRVRAAEDALEVGRRVAVEDAAPVVGHARLLHEATERLRRAGEDLVVRARVV